jgi:uncharacterized damage-inducible protein DinB
MNMRIGESVRPAHCDITGPAVAVLEQLYGVIEALSDEQYIVRPVGKIDSSIGAHVRHCLDHFQSLIRAVETRRLDYDQRERGTPIESDRIAALSAITELQRRLVELPAESVSRTLWLTAMLSESGPSVELHSSLGRELAYVLSHTIHHHALIGAMVKTLGGTLPPRFGYAPATIAARERMEAVACARSA